ncbi:hypothetical protein AB870_25190 (plasmid) [Pandoraea faecigallinarum]|uniref:Uncharacterized protein n=1 Tax=Pandoraea faecigallinarum TaxID=656179 RepID=A0A0H3WZD7_9BURK|nr:hypothetical protein AB870_25190 [Pandoraea faecigallinarum]
MMTAIADVRQHEALLPAHSNPTDSVGGFITQVKHHIAEAVKPSHVGGFPIGREDGVLIIEFKIKIGQRNRDVLVTVIGHEGDNTKESANCERNERAICHK